MKEKLTKPTIISIVLIIVTAVMAGMFAYQFYSMQNQIKALKADIPAIPAEQGSHEEEMLDIDYTEAVEEAEIAAKTLADLESEWSAVMFEMNVYSNDTERSEGLLGESMEYQDKIGEMFNGGKVASGNNWYMPNYYEVEPVLKVLPVYEYSASAANVRWQWVDEQTGYVMAFVSANYNFETGMFEKAEKSITDFGNVNMASVDNIKSQEEIDAEYENGSDGWMHENVSDVHK